MTMATDYERGGRTNSTYVHSNRFAQPAAYTIKEHRHETWQAEYIVRGTVEAHAGTQHLVAEQGDSVLLPPRIPHWFDYREEGAEVFSIKFAIERVPDDTRGYVLRRSDEAEALWHTLRIVLRTGLSPRSHRSRAVNSLLDALLAFFWHPARSDTAQAEQPIVAETKRRIASTDGKPLAVSDLAKQLRCSEQYLRARFRNETGEQLKKYIDRYRANCIEQYIAHSDMSLKQIAFHFGFPDPQTFSRFVQRTLGYPPRTVRRHIRTSNNAHGS
ncbi:MAG: helix-turn-helix domain-containing protein, partial [Chitinivibrionales bacterium]|nr:helix-turn-helix domain-containing protein [Chitinivibrionales bacterium]